jgi:hypothetical protein
MPVTEMKPVVGLTARSNQARGLNGLGAGTCLSGNRQTVLQWAILPIPGLGAVPSACGRETSGERPRAACGLILLRSRRGRGVESIDWQGFAARQESHIGTEVDRTAYDSWRELHIDGQRKPGNSSPLRFKGLP